ncbi:MAG: exodeoxyribonuclease VII large subunit [Faecalibacterium prausnitzii]|nr:MAG: exodeoxyribonuclease VII large subunit [Faecalibacterium prausnitzii]
MAEVITVSALNQYVKTLLDANDLLFDLALRGEIANFVQNARSGHCYFSLRDASASVKAVMFRSDARRLGFRPEEGMKVVVRCRATLYERDGAFQIYVNEMFPDGIGAAQLAFEQLKAKKTGAALQDIRNVIGRRWPAAKLLLCPVNVQGFEAAQQVADAIGKLDKSGRVDEIIVARGGGSREDLWVFNAEVIARAAYRCKVPLISAIGHEIDFTILDFVADRRAPTPSAAAELAVPDRAELLRALSQLEQGCQSAMQRRLDAASGRLMMAEQQLSYDMTRRKLTGGQAELAAVQKELEAAAQSCIQKRQAQLRHAAALADSLSPYRVLGRGYAMVYDSKGRLCSADVLATGDKLTLRGGNL